MKKLFLPLFLLSLFVSANAQHLSQTRVANIRNCDTATYRFDKFGRNTRSEIEDFLTRLVAEMKKREFANHGTFGTAVQDSLTKYSQDAVQIQLSQQIMDSLAKDMRASTILSLIKQEIQQAHLPRRINAMIGYLRLMDTSLPADTIKAYAEKISYHSTAFLVWEAARDSIRKFKDSPDVYYEGLKRNLSILADRLEAISAQKYTVYNFTQTSNRLVKGVCVNVDNDFLAIASGAAGMPNKDRDYTGGARIELLTDFFKMRLFPLGKMRIFKNSPGLWMSGPDFLSYQGLFLGSEAYTPMIRDTILFTKDTVVDSLDRPFGSYQYFGWAKYRLHRIGNFRDLFQIKVGKVGGDRGRLVQAAIHRDITVDSPTPRGWGAQVASGGRIGYSLEYYPEFMIVSGDGDLLDKFRRRERKIPLWMNLSVLGDFRIGHDLTCWGAGVSLCNLSFKERSWNNHIMRSDRHQPRPASVGNFFRNDFIFALKAIYRWERHNSMLEGFGIWKHEPDNDPLSPIDIYVVPLKDLIRYTGQFEYLFGFKTQYANIYYKGVILSPETRLPKANKWHYWGTVGISFLVP